ncbi:hypothetical protein LMG31506_06434 [Cupriavidus yeoncheonensis]|uniref:Uncharacterized protein n=1 Tax=Cupriavidus yeoncheonensis TaxID=1462994 RepID=A0A916IZZ8_9BURK|nr:hypothetical protein [Cupriavidus yeoncheonensis]CAG2158612.1 hypothetical protein LMG31506_06434 [Cupriavidus yeoncheonensis]
MTEAEQQDVARAFAPLQDEIRRLLLATYRSQSDAMRARVDTLLGDGGELRVIANATTFAVGVYRDADLLLRLMQSDFDGDNATVFEAVAMN